MGLTAVLIRKEYNKLIDVPLSIAVKLLTDVPLSIAVKLLIAVGVCFECERLKDLSTILSRHFSRKCTIMNII